MNGGPNRTGGQKDVASRSSKRPHIRQAGLALCLVALSALTGCIESGAVPVSIGLFVRGADVASFEGRDGWQVELEVAELLYGPLYLCAGQQAGDLCDAARAEFLETVRIDALDPAPRSIGTLEGLSGTVRSAMWDYGRPWPLSASAPLMTAEGASVRVVGVARRGLDEVPFDTSLNLEPSRAGVILVRASELFEEELSGDRTLTVTTDPSRWLDEVRWEDVVDGAFQADSQPARALANALTTRARPVLVFDE